MSDEIILTVIVNCDFFPYLISEAFQDNKHLKYGVYLI